MNFALMERLAPDRCKMCGQLISGPFDGVDHPQTHDECAIRDRIVRRYAIFHGPPPTDPVPHLIVGEIEYSGEDDPGITARRQAFLTNELRKPRSRSQLKAVWERVRHGR